MTFAVVDIQGFYIEHSFVPKEITLSCDGINFQHYVFECIRPIFVLSNEDKRKVYWLERYHHAISYSQKGIQPSEVYVILKKFIKDNHIDMIYVKGHLKKQFLENIIHPSTEIINIEISDIQSPKFEKTINVCNSMVHNHVPAMCSKYNCLLLYNFLKYYF